MSRTDGTVAPPPQELGFARSADGTRIAYARHGAGPVLLVASCWLSHLQFDWESPVWRHFLEDLGRFATVVRYDERGHGLSDRDVKDFGLDARVADLEAVAEHVGVERFALLGMAQGGPVSVRYTLKHPDRVSRLIFYGSFVTGERDNSEEARELNAAYEQLIRVGWARPGSEFRRVFTSSMIPDATEEQMQWLDELQRVAVSADVAVKARRQRRLEDVSGDLGQIAAPTLVLHCRGDHMVEFEAGRVIASGIRGAKLVPLESTNHIVLAHEPAWDVFLREVTEFLEPERSHPPLTDVDELSAREREVLRLVAEGRDNDRIAVLLSISPRTVERHLQNTYAKLGVGGKSARAAAVARMLSRA
jgi:pimeloyl-ACP methyl ester carboxylesterase/DNA-binding CsgD family transcriptional regulator